MDLASNYISGILPAETSKLKSHIILFLSNNRINGPLPAEVGTLTALHTLFIDHNNFSGDVPSTLVNLTDLFPLNLSGNAWTSLNDVPDDIVEDDEFVQAWLAKLITPTPPRANHLTLTVSELSPYQFTKPTRLTQRMYHSYYFSYVVVLFKILLLLFFCCC